MKPAEISRQTFSICGISLLDTQAINGYGVPWERQGPCLLPDFTAITNCGVEADKGVMYSAGSSDLAHYHKMAIFWQKLWQNPSEPGHIHFGQAVVYDAVCDVRLWFMMQSVMSGCGLWCSLWCQAVVYDAVRDVKLWGGLSYSVMRNVTTLFSPDLFVLPSSEQVLT